MSRIFRGITGTLLFLVEVLLHGHLHAQAVAGEPRHPILSPKGRGDEKLLSQFSDAEWLALIPAQSPRQAVFSLGERDVPIAKWDWDPRHPDQLTNKATGEVFPSARFPQKEEKVEVLSGKTVEVPYVDGKRGKDQPQAYIDYHKFYFLEGRLRALGAAYAGTGDERYARIVALVLDAWANRIPDYFISGRGGPISPQEADKERWFVSRVSDHNAMAHEWPHFALAAFDCIYDSRALQELSAQRKYDVRAHITKDFFANIGDVFAHRIKPEWAIETNLDPYMVLADAATILNRPDYITYLNEYLAATMGNFCRDGMFPESFTYHRGYAGANYNVAQNVAKYFTIRPSTTEDLRATQARSAERLAFLKHCNEAHWPVCYPNGLIPPFGDSSAANDAPRTATRSAVLPAYGFVALGNGAGARQTQLDIGFNDFNNHCQADVLGFTLFAFEQEVIGNNRYARSAGRAFNNSTLGHNTVVIDRENQSRREGGEHLFTSGNLTLYDPGLDGIAVAEVDGSRAYSGKATRYQRLLILNTVDLAHPYVVDLFAVSGGKMHDYVLHGATTFEQKATASLPLKSMAAQRPLLAAGEVWRDPRTMTDSFPIYGMIQQVSEGRSPGGWDVTYLGTKQPVGLRLFMSGDSSSQVLLGRSPVIGGGPAGEADSDPVPREEAGAAYANSWRPALIVRRQSTGSEPLQSLFAALIEPLNGASAIVGFDRLPLTTENVDAVALRIRFADGRTDVVLVNMDNPAVAGCPGKEAAFTTRDGGYALHGHVGVQVQPKVGPGRVVMLGAERFQYGRAALVQSAGALTGKLVAVKSRLAGDADNAFITEVVLPPGPAWRGRWLSLRYGPCQIASNGGASLSMSEQTGISEMFQIESIEQRDGKTWILLADDPALAMTPAKITELLRPHRSFYGGATFEIALRTSKP